MGDRVPIWEQWAAKERQRAEEHTERMRDPEFAAAWRKRRADEARALFALIGNDGAQDRMLMAKS